MPRATDNRPAVGTIPCDGCGQTATLYQVQKGNRKGNLYKRCGCGCDQRNGRFIQRQWLEGMNANTLPEGQWIEHPLNLQGPEPVQEPEPAPVQVTEKTETVPAPEPTGTKPRGGLIGLAVIAGAAALAIISN